MSSSEFLSRCDGRWLEILTRFCHRHELIAAIDKMGKPHVTPSRSDPIDSEIPNAIAWIMAVRGWTLPEAEREIDSYLGGGRNPDGPSSSLTDQPELTSSPADLARRPRPLRSRLRAIWDASLPIEHDRAEPLRRYFAEQGLAGIEAHAPNVRCHRALGYYERDEHDRMVHRGDFPTLLAPLTHEDSADELVGLYGIYLTDTGHRAPVRNSEKLVIAREVDNPAGAAIRLFPAERMLGLTLGLETACAVKLGSGMPIWAIGFSSLLIHVKLPRFVRHVFDWVDVDPQTLHQDGTRQPGHDASERLNTRLCAEGKDAYVVRPHPAPTGRKLRWIDVYRERGTEGFPPLMQLLRPLPTAYRLTRDE